MIEDAEQRLERALESKDPLAAARQLATDLKAEGMGQVPMYRLYSKYQVLLSGEDPRYDAVFETLDRICSDSAVKASNLFEQPLTVERLESEK